ncbi:S-adenosylmethionine:tRNA ribosyltransferase-isomerase [bacterium]|nr:S-adenosylmethionine:tRNA ribosyltransferase-isomerase [bacterium]
MLNEEIKKSDFYFDLPEDRIAKYPLKNRSESKLLVYRDGNLSTSQFKFLPQYLEKDDVLIFNNARVIPARLYFKRSTGAMIEVLLLEPVSPASYEEMFRSSGPVEWEAMIGNLRKWKEGEDLVFHDETIKLTATLVSKEEKRVRLSWESKEEFIMLLESLGELPLPPYMNRTAETEDYESYQTVYAKINGSVAAPTAGLHFEAGVMRDLQDKGVGTAELTLHVGAGTFLPVKEENVTKHPMHREHFELTMHSLDSLIHRRSRIAVGTTSLRVLESLYWMGNDIDHYASGNPLPKLKPYEQEGTWTFDESLMKIREYMEKHDLETLYASTEIMILPQYKIRSVKALITNFHLPESTLLLLVSAVTKNNWREIYNYALKEDYRFLSYGDSSLLFVE